MLPDTSYQCSLCKKEFKFSDIRYTDDGKRIVCQSCYAKPISKEYRVDRKSQLANKSDSKDVIKYFCPDCRYRFTFKKDSKVSRICPYCGEGRIIEDKMTADELVAEASSRKYDY